jgi:hypothetical protein
MVHVDFIFLAATSVGGNRLLLFAVDEHSKYLFAVAIKQKTAQEVEAGFRKLIAHFNSYGHKIRAIMSDHEAVFGAMKVPMGLLQIEMIQAGWDARANGRAVYPDHQDAAKSSSPRTRIRVPR